MKKVVKVWTFQSDSSPNKIYETLQFEDGSTSCGCMGWTRRVDVQGNRTCKHTRMVDAGTADSQATSHHDYRQTTQTVSAPAHQAQQAPAKKAKAKVEKVLTRKIVW